MLLTDKLKSINKLINLIITEYKYKVTFKHKRGKQGLFIDSSVRSFYVNPGI